MSDETVIRIAIGAFIALLIAAVRWWVRKHPNLSKEHPERRRMVKLFPIVGWLVVIIGFIMGASALLADAENAGGAVPVSGAMILGGAVLLLMYRNFYVAPGEYEVAFRNFVGKERVIIYTDIVRHGVMPPFVSIKSAQGVKLDLNINIYDMTPLLRAIEVRDATGQWPVRPADAPRDIVR